MSRAGMFGVGSEQRQSYIDRLEKQRLDEMSELDTQKKLQASYHRLWQDERSKKNIGAIESRIAWYDRKLSMLDPNNKDGDGTDDPLDDDGEMAKVHGRGNRILHVKIGNIIETNEYNFTSGDLTQQENEAEQASNIITQALISTLKDLGQIQP